MAIPDRIVWEMRLTLCQEEKYMGLVIRQQTLLCEVNGHHHFTSENSILCGESDEGV